MITGVEHIAIFSLDPKLLRDWYVRVFGFWSVKEDDSKGTYWLQAPDGMLFELKRAEWNSTEHREKAFGIRHIALTTSNFEETVIQLQAENVEILTAPTISATGGKTFFFRDPEGNIFQLISRSTPLFKDRS